MEHRRSAHALIAVMKTNRAEQWLNAPKAAPLATKITTQEWLLAIIAVAAVSLVFTGLARVVMIAIIVAVTTGGSLAKSRRDPDSD